MAAYDGFLGLTTLHGKGDGLEYSQEFVNIFKFQTLAQLHRSDGKPEWDIESLGVMGLWLDKNEEVSVCKMW